jgi:hypothetical protein
MSTESFLSEFPPVTTDAWEEEIRKDLKGADYSGKLIWNPEDKLKVRPYYRADDIARFDFVHAAPGEFPFLTWDKVDSGLAHSRRDRRSGSGKGKSGGAPGHRGGSGRDCISRHRDRKRFGP